MRAQPFYAPSPRGQILGQYPKARAHSRNSIYNLREREKAIARRGHAQSKDFVAALSHAALLDRAAKPSRRVAVELNPHVRVRLVAIPPALVGEKQCSIGCHP